jgi:hypothetical protein
MTENNLEYNSTRPLLLFSEYGRNIQNLVNHLKTIEDKEERNGLAETIIGMMGAFYPQMKDIPDFKHKLWDHLFMMADYELDVDAPYPPPSKNDEVIKPERVPYPDNKIKFKHYGKNVEMMLEKIKLMEGEEQKEYGLAIANFMKMAYMMWNSRDAVSDEQVLSDLQRLTDKKVDIEGMELANVRIASKPQNQNRSNSNKGGQKRKQQPRRKK